MENIYVTSPSLPPLEEYQEYLASIWQSKKLTNYGPFHEKLEAELSQKLGVEHLMLTSNGTLALVIALQEMRITGEVITTPFSFAATTHALHWNGIKPVFSDIDPQTYNLDPAKIEAAITPRTTAILPVHVYGTPCDMEAIGKIADTYGLKVLYDAAHAFGVEKDGQSILNFGDMSVLSFHATKAYNTVEGGAIVCKDAKTKQRLRYLQNFGIADELTIVAPGINAKMNEFQAAFGLLQLKYVDGEIDKREKVWNLYDSLLDGVPGITRPARVPRVRANYSYYPVLVDGEAFGTDRDGLYQRLKEDKIFARRYFYPLISEFPTYRGLPSADRANLPNAHRVADRVLCLPIFADLSPEAVQLIVGIIREIALGQ